MTPAAAVAGAQLAGAFASRRLFPSASSCVQPCVAAQSETAPPWLLQSRQPEMRLTRAELCQEAYCPASRHRLSSEVTPDTAKYHPLAMHTTAALAQTQRGYRYIVAAASVVAIARRRAQQQHHVDVAAQAQQPKHSTTTAHLTPNLRPRI